MDTHIDDIATIAHAARALRAGEVTSVELLRRANARADEIDAELGVYLARFDETALEAAERADAELAAGVDRGPLHGVPLGIKDVIAAWEGPTTGQSLITPADWGRGHDAPAVARLRAVGGVITGKTTTMELAIGFADPTKPFPVPRNPWNPAAWPGGSSSGSGIGVATGAFLGAIGTDTGGSIRCPAALCGVTGLMPTFGRVPKSGTLDLAYSLDHVGPLARSAWDCAAMLEVMAGHDASDHQSSHREVPSYLDGIARGVGGVRVGVVRAGHFHGDEAAPVVGAFDLAVQIISDLGAQVSDAQLPYYDEVTGATQLMLAAEAAAINQRNLQARWDDYFATSRAGVMSWGALFSAIDYVQAGRVRRAGQRALGGVFAEVDVIVSPTFTIGAPTYETIEKEGLGCMLGRGHTTYWDGVGNPVIAIPIGFTGDGLPLSMQIAGRPFAEGDILRVAHAFQTATTWHERQPVVGGTTATTAGGSA